MSSIHSKLQHKKDGRTFRFYGTTITNKISTGPLKKVQNKILLQNNVFQSRYIDSQQMSELFYFKQGTVILLCSLLTRVLQFRND